MKLNETFLPTGKPVNEEKTKASAGNDTIIPAEAFSPTVLPTWRVKFPPVANSLLSRKPDTLRPAIQMRPKGVKSGKDVPERGGAP